MFRELRALLSEYLARVATYQASTLLAAVYWGVIGPTGLLIHLFGRHLLSDSYGSGTSHWIARPPVAEDPAALYRQY